MFLFSENYSSSSSCRPLSIIIVLFILRSFSFFIVIKILDDSATERNKLNSLSLTRRDDIADVGYLNVLALTVGTAELEYQCLHMRLNLTTRNTTDNLEDIKINVRKCVNEWDGSSKIVLSQLWERGTYYRHRDKQTELHTSATGKPNRSFLLSGGMK